ncbi:MAG TPA: hypothetical protein DIC19_01055 [Erysipelotrichaceae bacterium]|nr:hypothetical protein [Erysipelotrichaceae bacterium]
MKKNIISKWGFILIFLSAWFITSEVIHRDIQFNSVWSIGKPLSFGLDQLSHLSLSSSLGNLFAWLIFITVSALPILILQLVKTKYSKHRLSYWIAILMGAFLALSIYGSLNYLFMSPFPGIAFELQAQMHATLITISLVLFIVLLLISLHWPIKSEERLIRLFQTFLWLLAYLGLALMGVLSALVLNPTFQVFQPEWFNALIQLFAQLLPMVLLIRLIPNITELIDRYGKEGFSTELHPLLEKITTKNAQAVYGMFIIPLVYNLYQLILFTNQKSAHFTFNFPWIELILSITILFVMHLLKRAIKLQSENEGFV